MSRLESVGEGIWTAALPLKLGLFEMGTRTTIVRLPDGGLFVHSPAKLDPELKAEIDALGPVRLCAAPNKYHHLFVRDWKEAYPDARILAAPGLPEKRRSFEFDGVLSNEPEEPWRGTLEQRIVDGAPGLGEVVFCHPASGTLLVTDLVMNIHDGGFATRTFARLIGAHRKLAATRLTRMLIKDRAAARASLDHILAWPFDRILLAHGATVETGGQDALRAAYAWL